MLQKGDKKLINAWAFYDWANSVYSLVIATAIFPIYYDAITGNKTVSFLGMSWEHPDALFSYSISFSMLVVAFISPILSGIADYTGNKLKFLKTFCLIGSLAVMSLYFFQDESTVWIAIVFSVIASIGFWGSIVFYNAYLPEVAHPEQQDKASAKGFMFGYFGSIILLLISLGMVMAPQLFGFDVSIDESIKLNGSEQEIKEAMKSAKDMASLQAMRISFILVGIWWLGFAQITYRRLPKNEIKRKAEKGYIKKGFNELKKVLNEVKKYPQLKIFLISFFLFSVGVQTIIYMAGIFGSKELKLPSEDLIAAILIVQIVAILGAFVFSRLTEKIGNIKALKITIATWGIVCFLAFMIDKTSDTVAIQFYTLAGLIGFVMGAIQSLSRSTYSKLLPETEDNTTYFSFYDVTEKIAIVLGTLVFGLLIYFTDSMQWSVLCLGIFFLASFIVLNFIKKTKYVK